MAGSKIRDRLSEEITEDSLAPLLRTKSLGRVVYAFKECESTNLLARRLVEGDKLPEHGTLIVTDFQRAGRGRNVRAWQAPPGRALLFTLILRGASPGNSSRGATPLADAGATSPTSGPGVTMAVSVGVARALRAEGIEGATIKWPNDILSRNGRKICGILTEQTTPPRGEAGVFICGIGINVNQTARDFAPELRVRATSMRIELRKPVSRLLVLARVLKEIETCLGLGAEDVFATWQRLSSTIGKAVRVRQGGRVIAGTAMHLEADGRLTVRTPSGRVHSFHSGEIEEVRAADGEQ